MRYSIGKFDGEELFIVVNDTVLNVSYKNITTPYCVQLYTCRYLYQNILNNCTLNDIRKKECANYNELHCIYIRSIKEMKKYIYMTFIYDLLDRKYRSNCFVDEFVWELLNTPIEKAFANTYNLLKQKHDNNHPNVFEGLDYRTRLSLHPYENGIYN